MSPTALALVLASAFAHATWNLMAKQSSGGAAFVWLFTSIAALMWAPLALAVALVQSPTIAWTHVGFMAGTGVLHAAYFISLQRGYDVSDLSLIYPLSRGIGPLLATGAAITLLGERPTYTALGGTLLIGLGAISLTRTPKGTDAVSGVGFAMLTGALIASYTLWDKYAVDTLAIPPILYDWANNFGRGMVLLPLALTRREVVATTWKMHRRYVIGVAILSPLAYILVLTALSFAPVSYVAPARELSIVIGTALGAYALAEGDARRRLAGAAAIVAGVGALSVG